MNQMIKVGAKRKVAMRYTMKNAEGEVLADIMQEKPVTFLYGSGEILPELEGMLAGLKIGEHKSFCINPDNKSDVNRQFHFNVIIDDIEWATEFNPQPMTPEIKNANESCGPEGCC
jgi:hypothetical protein